MKNLFDSDNYPDSVPEELFVGNRWAWTASAITAVYPTALYTLEYRFCLQEASHSDFDITASKVSSAHVVEVGQATTAAYNEGLYWWQAVVIRDSDSEEVTVDQGFTNLNYDLGTHAGDTRSQTYKTLTAIRATIAQTATKEQASYSVAGRSLSRRTPSELLELEREFARRWEDEKKDIARKNGRTVRNRTVVKLSGT